MGAGARLKGTGTGRGKGWRASFSGAAKAKVVRLLARGETVAAAARRAGFAVQTLYGHRARCAAFRAAWDEAVEASRGEWLVEGAKGRKYQLRKARRNAFTRERKEAFLDHFAATCDARASAAVAGVAVSTVYAHLRTDAVFRQGWMEALEQGYARLEAEAVAQRIRAIERYRVPGDKIVADGDADEGGGGVRGWDAESDAEFERTLCLLREHKRTLAGADKGGRKATAWSFEQALDALEKQLAAFGIEAPAAAAGGADG